ncbi:dTDP-4-dehydrorhamnose 3,5-epimerase [Roseivirga sp. BDSF3-8]|uniref:dTDP-4-dehydrorhamnose 3,5-epimerase n=1 Tax=Roseivirga sp. BDSF3-8 TaxID=3241598 RepID=UPI0035323F1C
MQIIKTEFPGLFLVKPRILEDHRGYFYEAFNYRTFRDLTGIDITFVQDNQSTSHFGVMRGLHYQLEPYGQAKLVRVLHGRIVDVVVDLRRDSPTFGKSYTLEMSHEDHTQIFVPKGFAHGFVVLSEKAEVIYKCDAFYTPAEERGLYYNDPVLNIDWRVAEEDIIISEKDKKLPLLKDAEYNFSYSGHSTIIP